VVVVAVMAALGLLWMVEVVVVVVVMVMEALGLMWMVEVVVVVVVMAAAVGMMITM
jgi:hypothetical protein